MLAVGFLCAWLFGPLLVLHYRLEVIPRRLKEILAAFGPDKRTDQDQTLPIVRYERLMRPYSRAIDPWKFVEQQFMRFHGGRHYVLPLILLAVFTGISLYFCYGWVMSIVSPPPVPRLPPRIFTQLPTPVVTALLGAYVWSLYEILTRRRSGDLTPDDLYDIAVRQLAAVPIGYSFAALVFDKLDPALAFAASAFPLRDIRQILRQRILSQVSQDVTAAKAYEAQSHVSQVIDGISIETAARLEELHIITAMDLAYTDPVKLMVRTGFSIRHVLAWIDQAMLTVYFGPHRDAFRKLGIPCALDLCELYQNHCYDRGAGCQKDWSKDPVLETVGNNLGITVDLLVERLWALYWDPHVRFLESCWYTVDTVPCVPRRVAEAPQPA